MEKKIPIKTLYLLLVISICLIGLGVGSTYAMFTTSAEISKPISIASNLSHASDVMETAQVTVPANSIVTTTLNITNDSTDTLNYTTWYINNDNIKVICENNSSQGTLTTGSSASIVVKIVNNSTESMTVNLGVSSTLNDSNIVLGSNMKQVENVNLLMSVEEAPSDSTATFLSSVLQRGQISSITFVDNIDVPSNYTSLDVSKYTDGSILMWYGEANDNGNYDVYIGSDKGQTYVDSGYFLFSYLTNLNLINFNDLLDTSLTETMKGMFAFCSNLTTLNINNFDTSKVTSIQAIFTNCTNLQTLNISNWNTSKVTSMRASFNRCKSLTFLDVSNWDVSNVTTMYATFQGCISLTSLDLSTWDVSNVTTMQFMFFSNNELGGDMSLVSIGDVENWNTGNVNNMNYMFQYCTNLVSLNFSNWDVSNVIEMKGMFYNCASLESLDVSNWNVSNVLSFQAMFQYCGMLQELDISSWNTSNATSMVSMFEDCTSLTKIYVSNNWSTANVTESTAMFYNCTSLVGGSGTTYNSSYIDATYARIDGGTSTPGYFSSKV